MLCQALGITEEHNRNKISAIMEHRVVGDTDANEISTDNQIADCKSDNSHEEKELGVWDYNIPFGDFQKKDLIDRWIWGD